MPRFSVEFSRELTEDEALRLTSMCNGAFETFEWEREQPAHVCERKHGGKVVDSKHEHEPVCHDCNRGLIRPCGGAADWWICPAVHNHPMRATKADQAVECGSSSSS